MARERKKLEIKCGQNDCDNGLHTYRPPKKEPNQPRQLPDACTCCGEKPVGWIELHKRRRKNINLLIGSMKTEFIRAYFWNKTLSNVSKGKVSNQSRSELATKIKNRINSSLAKAHPYRDGGQTRLEEDDNPIFYAQHATGTCCRKCMFYWHGIGDGVALTDEQVSYSEFLIWKYLQDKIPELIDNQGNPS